MPLRANVIITWHSSVFAPRFYSRLRCPCQAAVEFMAVLPPPHDRGRSL